MNILLQKLILRRIDGKVLYFINGDDKLYLCSVFRTTKGGQVHYAAIEGRGCDLCEIELAGRAVLEKIKNNSKEYITELTPQVAVKEFLRLDGGSRPKRLSIDCKNLRQKAIRGRIYIDN